MILIDKLERKLRKYSISNLMLYIIGAMIIVFAADRLLISLFSEYEGFTDLISMLSFDRDAIFHGQVWRVFSFAFIPPDTSIIWLIFSLYFYYIIGTALETQWGSTKFDIYYFTGIICLIVAGFICGFSSVAYLDYALVFAFAVLFPDFEVLLFFFIPVKIKYIAIFEAICFALAFVFGTWQIKVIIALSLVNFFLFFGEDIIGKIKFFFKYKQYKTIFRKFGK